MKELTPFQRALLDAVSEQYADIPDDAGAIPAKTHRRTRPLRVLALIAAVIGVLTISVFALPPLRNALSELLIREDVVADEFGGFHSYVLSWAENLAEEGAPDHIETFFLPTAFAAKPVGYSIADDQWMASYTFLTEDGGSVRFRQSAACAQTKNFVSMNFDADVRLETEKLERGEYEIVAVRACRGDQVVGEFWYWTDQTYLFEIIWPEDGAMSRDEMFEIFSSVQPVDPIQDYLPDVGA